MNAILELKPENQIAEFNPFIAQLAELEKEYGTRVYDLTDPAQNKAARSDRLKVAKVISAFEVVRKDAKAEAQTRVKHVDGNGKIIRDRMEMVLDSIKNQLEAHDREIQEHAEMLQAKVDAIRRYAEFTDPITLARYDLTAADLVRRLETVELIDVNDTFEDRKADATLAQVETVKKLKAALESRQKLESEQAELERLRKEKEERERADREERIRQEAAEKAKQEAAEAVNRAKVQQEAAEARIKETEARAKAEQERATQKALQAAEQAKTAQAEAVAKAEQAERDRIAREQAKKAQDEAAAKAKEEKEKARKTHKNKIHKEATDSLFDAVDFDLSDGRAMTIISLIIEGKIKHVTINY